MDRYSRRGIIAIFSHFKIIVLKLISILKDQIILIDKTSAMTLKLELTIGVTVLARNVDSRKIL